MGDDARVEKQLTLGINGWRMHGLRTGVARYLSNIVSRWDSSGTPGFSRIRFYTGHPLESSAMKLPSNIEPVVLRSRLPMIPWENLRLGIQSNDDVLFAPSHSLPLYSRGKAVVAIHDALLHLHPERFPWTARQLHDRLYGWSGRHATLVITDSNAAAADIASSYGVPPEKIRVVYLAADEAFRTTASERNERRQANDSGSSSPYFLFVGKMSGRRDIPMLLNGFAEFKRRNPRLDHRLVLAGANVHGLELDRLIEHAGIVGTSDLRRAPHRCRIEETLRRGNRVHLAVGLRNRLSAGPGGAGRRHSGDLHRFGGHARDCRGRRALFAGDERG